MKLILSVISIIAAGLVMAADEGDFVPTPRDEAVAALASKRGEANSLRAELDDTTKQLNDASAALKKATAYHNEIMDETDEHAKSGKPGIGPAGMGLASTFASIEQMGAARGRFEAAQRRLEQLNRRLKQLDAEVITARGALNNLDSKTSKNTSRNELRPTQRPDTMHPAVSTKPGGDCGRH